MREILFRGKRIDNGEWVYGDLTRHRVGRAHIRSWENLQFNPAYNAYEVDPETVGQFTGLADKNGKEIFEGDIVRIRGDQTSEDWKQVDYFAMIAFLNGGFCAIDRTIEEHSFRRYGLCRMDFDLEVIGNIHDNPEFLEVPHE